VLVERKHRGKQEGEIKRRRIVPGHASSLASVDTRVCASYIRELAACSFVYREIIRRHGHLKGSQLR
jgi:hypothetical protein